MAGQGKESGYFGFFPCFCQRKKLRERTPEQKALIEEAKSIIMQNNGMTEAEAHSYLQKYSMDSGMNMVNTAKLILEVF